MNLFTPVFQFVQNVADFFVNIWSDQTDAVYEVVGTEGGDYMGVAIAFSENNYMVLGDGLNSREFQVYKYENSEFVREAKIVGSFDNNTDFGNTLDINKDGNIIVVGERGKLSGRVHVYQKTTDSDWVDQLSTVDADITNNPQYAGYFLASATVREHGSSVAISDDGTTIVAGDPGRNGGQIGGVTVYYQPDLDWATRFSTNNEEDGLLELSAQTSGDFAGTSVAINQDGTVVFAGVSGWDGTASSSDDRGAIAVWEKGAGWPGHNTTIRNETALLVTSDASPSNHRLGFTIACDAEGNTVVGGNEQGRLNESTVGRDTGLFDVFEKGSGWSSGATSNNHVARIVPGTNTTSDNYDFGSQAVISKDGNYIVGHEHNLASPVFNQVFVFAKGNGWGDFGNNLVATLSDTNLSASSDRLSRSADNIYWGTTYPQMGAISYDNTLIAFSEDNYDSDVTNVGKTWIWKSDV